MILWIVLTLMVALAAVGLTFPLARGRAALGVRASTLDVLKGQLAELDAQAAAGALPPEDADGLRTEIKRRMLAEGREPDAVAKPLGERRLMYLAFAVVAAVAISGTLLYARLGRPDLAGPTVPASTAAPTDPLAARHPGGGDVPAVIGQLEAQLKAQPNNAQGWAMLGWSYFQTARYAEAAQAYARASALDPANAESLSAEGESYVRAADGQVTPDAEAAFRKALAADPADPRARYFRAVAKDQKGDHTGALDDWVALLRSAPPGAPWAAEVRAFVLKVAKARGEDVSARLPPAPAAEASAATPGPNADQVAAASQMSDADRRRMIAGMVDKLAAKLKAQPHDVEGWVRLMQARLVLGQPDRAAAAYRDAQKALSGAELAQVREGAKGLGVPGA
jgi:cytochrome c-type biogenesis protein CcmH